MNGDARPGKGGRVAEGGPATRTSVPADAQTGWRRAREAWLLAGDSLPRPGSAAWRLLDVEDPVRAGVAAAEDLGVLTLVAAHGPLWARRAAS